MNTCSTMLMSLFVFWCLMGRSAQLTVPFPVNAQGWRLAVPDDSSWEWVFPDVYRPQKAFKTEWWYYTGHLKSEKAEWFGYQFTLFRIGMRPPQSISVTSETGSAWRFDDLWMGHFALTDIHGKTYQSFDRLVRGAMDLGGWKSVGDSTSLWVGDWVVRRQASDLDPSDQIHLISATREGWGIKLEMENGHVFFQGEKGLSRKGSAYGQASWYYTRPQMKTKGVIHRPDGSRVAVTGMSWFDREIASNQLSENQVGWDWFAVQLESGDSLMIYRMRLRGGGFDATSHGQWMPGRSPDEEGQQSSRFLNATEFEIVPGSTWKSPNSGAVYPIEWSIRVPSLNLELELDATLPSQEFQTENGPAIQYWEGSHTVTGRFGNRDVSGRAYVELTGYSGAVPGLTE